MKLFWHSFLGDGNEVTQMTKFHCKATYALKAYLYHTKHLLTIVKQSHRISDKG
jgi:hypothetical protein